MSGGRDPWDTMVGVTKPSPSKKPTVSVETYRGDPLYPRIVSAVERTRDPRIEEAYSRHFMWPGKGPFHPPASGEDGR